ncbi:MAG TPA: sigma-70 family RNA polymerase sigma factor [Acidimicrobiales bacterium]|nr:sigma-70 family RNA polymerase sigma factor [Acidimicrobiales bacterium]
MDQFDETWRHVEGRLLRMLALQGLDPHAARDIAQEVAERVIRKHVAFDHVDNLYPWARHVARQLAIDHFRRVERVGWVQLPEEIEVDGDGDIDDRVEHRQQLRRVVAAIARLSPNDRELILSSLFDHDGPPVSRRHQVRINVARHRARARLAFLVAHGEEGWCDGAP